MQRDLWPQLRPGNGIEQGNRIGVLRAREQNLFLSLLDDGARVHHADAVAQGARTTPRL